MELIIGGDHAGFDYKEALKKVLNHTHKLHDLGPESADSVDYPDFAHPLAKAVGEGEYPLGILICGSGNGVCMTANKHPNVRAALCWNAELAALARQHNNANVLCLASRFIAEEQAIAITKAFLEAEFEGGRHARRVGKI